MREAVKEGSELLSARGGIDEARLEAEILLMHVLKTSRAGLYAHLNDGLSSEKHTIYLDLIERRLSGDSVWYIIGHREFFGLDFVVDRQVLVPRPETEMLVQKALDIVKGLSMRHHEHPILADIGTGSGAIAVSLAVHLPQARVYATDISQDALKVAAINCRRLGVSQRVILVQGDLLAPLPEPVDIIAANLPYVSQPEMVKMKAISGIPEPELALAGGPEGLDKIEQLLQQAPPKLKPRGVVLLEIGYQQGQSVMEMAKRAFPRAKIELCKDFASLDRMVSIET